MSRIKPMYLILDSKTRQLLCEPAVHNINCIFDNLLDAENYQKNITGALKGKTEVVIKYPQFLNMFEIQQLEKIEQKIAEKEKEKEKIIPK